MIFGQFWQKKIHEIDLFDFTSFLAWTFFNLLAYYVHIPQNIFYRNRRKGGPGGGGRKTPGAPGTPQRRRSRMKSGDSASNISADETGQDSTAGASSPGPFRFPKTKKSLMSDWLQV